MKYILIGNGPSAKGLLDIGIDTFFKRVKAGYIVICMNKIIRYPLTHYPQYYLAADTFVNIQLYGEILDNLNNFEKAFIAFPHSLTKTELIKRYNIKEMDITCLNLTDQDVEKIHRQMEELRTHPKVVPIHHECTGLQAMKMCKGAKEIYMIGMDESYSLKKDSMILTADKFKDKYFFKDYIKTTDIVSWAPRYRVNIINKSISYHIKNGVAVYNLSTISKLNGKKTINLKQFWNSIN